MHPLADNTLSAPCAIDGNSRRGLSCAPTIAPTIARTIASTIAPRALTRDLAVSINTMHDAGWGDGR